MSEITDTQWDDTGLLFYVLSVNNEKVLKEVCFMRTKVMLQDVFYDEEL